MIEKSIDLVIRSAQDVVDREGIDLKEPLGPDTPLFGRKGIFDSLGLVSLIVGVEEAMADEFGTSVSLADERAMSQANSPFRTIRSLAEYAAAQLDSSNARSA